MKAIALAGAVLAALTAHGQVSTSTFDDFQDGTTMFWGGGADPVNVPTGGPGGVDDKFLQITSRGGIGAGSRLAVNNFESRWIGDYRAAGVTAVKLWLKNLSNEQLSMRIVLFQGTFDRFTSNNEVVLAPQQDWTLVSFPIGPSDLVRVQGSITYDQLIVNVNEVMVRHDADPPSAGGDAIVASAGLDNIQAVGVRTVAPSGLTVNLGQIQSGNIGSLAADDANPLVVCKFFVPNLQSPIIRFSVTGTTAMAPVTGLAFTTKVRMIAAGSFTQTTSLFNFSANAYEESLTDTVNLGYKTITLNATGNVSRYIGSGGTLQSRIEVRQTGPSTSLLPCSSWEYANWTVSNQ